MRLATGAGFIEGGLIPARFPLQAKRFATFLLAFIKLSFIETSPVILMEIP
jgi:hypothetical protein